MAVHCHPGTRELASEDALSLGFLWMRIREKHQVVLQYKPLAGIQHNLHNFCNGEPG